MTKQKKDEMDFHIHFNKHDPRQRKAARILNKVGRQKAIIIGNALWDFDEDEFEQQEVSIVNNKKVKPRKPSEPKASSSQVRAENEDEQTPSQREHRINSSRNSNMNSALMSSIVATMGQFQDS